MNSATVSAERGVIRVLIVDDEPDLRFTLRRVLRADGRFDVVGEAGDGIAAVDHARSLRPDVVVLDLAMPRCAGDEALPALREAVPDSMVVVFSASDISQRRDELEQLGAFACYEKSWLHELGPMLTEDLQRFRAAG